MAFSTFNSIQSFLMYVRASVGNLATFTYNFPALDPSLVLYYPMDSSANVGGGFKTANFASRLPVYDASLAGSSMITYAPNNTITSFGDLSLNNTMGSQLVAQTASGNYVVSNTTFTPNISGGFSISLWFSCSGQLNKRGTLISLPLNKTSNGLQIDISGTNMLYSGWNVPQKQPVSFFKLASNTTDTGSNPGSYIAGTPTYSTYSSISAITNAFTGTITINPLLSASTGFTISFWTLSNSYNNINLLLKNSSNIILSTVEFHTTEAISYINYDTVWFPSMAKYIYFPIIPDTANVWYHYVFCITNTSTTLYVNPISSFSSTPVTSSKTGSTTSFSFSASGNYMVFDRTSGVQALRNVGFYNSILTPTEVNTIWTSGLSAN